VLPMVKMQGCALQNASPSLQADREVVLAAVMNRGTALEFADHKFKSDKEVVLAAVANNSDACRFVETFGEMWNDGDFVLSMVKKRGDVFPYVNKTAEMWNEKDFVLSMVKIESDAFYYVNKTADVWNDKDFVLSMVQMRGDSLKFATNNLKKDTDILLAAFKQMGVTVHEHMTEKELVMAAVSANGISLQCASDELREDKEVVLAAVTQRPAALKFALGGLSQDSDSLRESGIWDQVHRMLSYSRTEHAILSVKVSLAEKTTPYATEFASEMEKDSFLGQFQTYNLIAGRKHSCDPNFTDIQHQCRGTLDTCSIPEHENLTDDKQPKKSSCWRFTFRFHQEKCKATNGFMIQVQEGESLGASQRIEAEMAGQVGLKVFRTTTGRCTLFDGSNFCRLSNAVEAWYESGCTNMDTEIIKLYDRVQEEDGRSRTKSE